MDYQEMARRFDEATPNQGFVPEPLPQDLYPLEVAKIIRKEVTGNGAHRVALLVKVTEGPFEKRTALVDTYVKPGEFKTVLDENKKAIRDENGNVQREAKSKAEKDKAENSTFNMMRGTLGALGVSTAEPRVPEQHEDYYFQFYNVDNWVGQKFLGFLQKQGDNNRLSAWFNVDDPKSGLEQWRRNTLPKQNNKVARTGGASANAAVSI